jgi:hypothetical protein
MDMEKETKLFFLVQPILNCLTLHSTLPVRGCLGLLYSTFFSQTVSALHALSLKKKGGVVRAPKEVLHKLQFFMELLHGGVCGAEFVKQSQTPPKNNEMKLW